MCFMVYTEIDVAQMKRDFPLKHDGYSVHDQWKGSFLGPQKTSQLPVIYNDEGALTLEEMHWSLCPSWSKEFPCKWSTYNARMEREFTDKKTYKKKVQKIYQTPTFKKAFHQAQFCLIPLTHAVESCYWGPDAGNILRFHRKDHAPFYVAGLWDEWFNQKTGEIKKSVTLLTHTPYRYLYEKGHDRSIILLDENERENILLRPREKSEENYQNILSARVDQDWKHEIERQLKPGWEKKKPSESYIKNLEVAN